MSASGPPLDTRVLTRLARRAGKLALDGRAGGESGSVAAEIEGLVQDEVKRHGGVAVHGGRGGEALPAGEWVVAVDALDDPLAYEAGLPTWSVALALLRGGQPLSAVVFVPALDDLYVASAGRLRWQGKVVPAVESPQDSNLLLGAAALQRGSLLGLGRARRRRGPISYPICLVARGAAAGAIIGPATLRELAPGLAVLDAVGGALVQIPRGQPIDAKTLARKRTRGLLLAAAPGAATTLLRRLRR